MARSIYPVLTLLGFVSLLSGCLPNPQQTIHETIRAIESGSMGELEQLVDTDYVDGLAFVTTS